jgi:hypothetical protein
VVGRAADAARKVRERPGSAAKDFAEPEAEQQHGARGDAVEHHLRPGGRTGDAAGHRLDVDAGREEIPREDPGAGRYRDGKREPA